MQRLLGAFIAVLAAALTVVGFGASSAGAVTLDGRVELVHSDNFTTRKSTSDRILVVGSRKYKLTGRNATQAAAGSRVKVLAKQRGTTLTVSRVTTVKNQDRVGRNARSSAAEISAAGSAKVGVVLFRYRNEANPPSHTAANVQQQVLDANGPTPVKYFSEVTNGDLALNGSVIGPVTINRDRPAGCDWEGTIVPQVKAQIDPDGMLLAQFDMQVFVGVPSSSCPFGGAAKWPAMEPFAYVNGLPGSQAEVTKVVSHELGHQLNMDHASSYSCSVEQPIQPAGSPCRQEYGDPFDVMGNSGTKQLNNFHDTQMGAEGYAPNPVVREVTRSGTFTLYPSVPGSGVPTVLRIPRANEPATSAYYYLETRRPNGIFDNFSCSASYCDPAAKGVSIRIAPDFANGPLTQSLLVDTTPGTATLADAPLQQGATFADNAHNVKITNVSTDPATGVASVSVEVGEGGGAPPPAPRLIRARFSRYVKVSWSGILTSTGPLRSFDVYRDGQLIGTTDRTNYADVPSPGPHSYTVVARDSAGATSQQSQAAVVEMPSGTGLAPTVNIVSPTEGASVGNSFDVEAIGADDERLRMMMMFVDGRKYATRGGDNFFRTYRGRLASGPHKVVVAAVDRDGNTATAQVTVNVP